MERLKKSGLGHYGRGMVSPNVGDGAWLVERIERVSSMVISLSLGSHVW